MLHCELFTADKYQDVQGFHCGDEPWSVEVNEFINGENGHSQALKLLAEKRIEMWLYRLDNEKKVVGFGALSKPRDWEIDGIKHRTTTIYAFGVQTEFKGLPSGPSNERYSSLILSDLLDKATKYGRPLCGLFVHYLIDYTNNLVTSINFLKY